MTALKRVVGISQIVFSTDFPYSNMADREGARRVRRFQYAGTTDDLSKQRRKDAAQIRAANLQSGEQVFAIAVSLSIAHST